MSSHPRDSFFQEFFARIPPEVAESFTDAQLDAVKRAFGARAWGAHRIDFRISLPLGRRCYYLVLLAGKERRRPARIAFERGLKPLWTAANSAIVTAFLLMLAASLMSVIYTTKRSLGIDLIPGVDVLPDRAIERVLR